jgi:hypothetical protein
MSELKIKREDFLYKKIFYLQKFFPEIYDGYVDFSFLPSILPVYAEDWFVVPRWDKFFDNYNEAVISLLERFIFFKKEKYLTSSFKCLNQCIKKTRRSLMFWERIVNFQSEFIENFIVVPAQLGYRHISKSPAEVRRSIKNLGFKECDKPEFGLGVFEVGCILLTHHYYLDTFNYSGKWINCVGDTITNINLSPIFYKDKKGYLRFSVGLQDYHFEYYVSATAFYLHY